MTTSAWPLALRIAHGCMAALFSYAVYVQHNDVDPIVWMAVYGAAGLLSSLAAAGRGTWHAPVLLAAVALLWGLALAPRVLGKQSLLDSEEGREMLGLFITAAWMALLSATTFGRRHAPRAAPVVEGRARTEET